MATLVAGAPAFAASVHDIYIFNASGDGANPTGALVADAEGRLYGVTQNGGADRSGIVYRLTPPLSESSGWTEEILHSFSGYDGAGPVAGVTLGADGSVYGTTSAGGSPNGPGGTIQGDGVVFKLADTAGWPLTILHRFGQGVAGGVANSSVLFGSDGLLYGTTSYFGTATEAQAGITYNVSPQGSQTERKLLHVFGLGSDGIGPKGLSAVPHNYYNGFVGATNEAVGAAGGLGTVFAEQILGDGKNSYGVLYTFESSQLLYYPLSPPIAGTGALKKGFYGGGQFGGNYDHGGVYSLTPDDNRGLIETTLYSFGSQPNDPEGLGYTGDLQLVQADKSGTLVGTSMIGGAYGWGTFFELDPPKIQGGAWSEKVDVSFNLHSLTGAEPHGAPLKLHGVYYGTLTYTAGQNGGLGNGAVYEVIP